MYHLSAQAQIRGKGATNTFGTRYLVLTTLSRPDISMAGGQPSYSKDMRLVLRSNQQGEFIIDEEFRPRVPLKTPTFSTLPRTRRDSRQLIVHPTRRRGSQQVDVLPSHLRPSRWLYPEGSGPRRSDGKIISSPQGEHQLQRRRTGLIINDVSSLERKPQLFDTDSPSESEDQLPNASPTQLILAPREHPTTPPRRRIRDHAGDTSPQRRTVVERARDISSSDSDTERGGKPKTDLWTEITKDLVTRAAIEQLGYNFQETDDFYYVMEYLDYVS